MTLPTLRPAHAAIALLIPFFASCATIQDLGIGGGGGTDAPVEAPVALSLEERQEDLAGLVERDLESALRSSGNGRSDVVRKRPCYYKEYSEYPGGIASYTIDLREKESRTAPLSAEVTIQQQRFATAMHRSMEEAQADSDFLRNTGTETLSYEMRNGTWRRIGSMFVSDTTEELVDGEWKKVEAAPPSANTLSEDDEGWFRRTVDRLRFWE